MADQPLATTADEYVDHLVKITRLTRGVVREAIDEIAPEPGSVGVDLGCGIGVDSLLLAAAVGDGGRVIGLDPSSRMLEAARASAVGSGHTQTVEFCEGSIDRLPFDDSSVDWIWCKDVFWPMPGVVGDPVAALGELRRVLRPGGKVALLYWTSQTLLAGYPRLEALLGMHLVESMPYLGGVPPEQHFLRAAGWMRQAGFVDLRTRALGAGHLGPMDQATQDSMSCLFNMFFGEMEARLSGDDWAQLRRITEPGSPDYLPRREDYSCLLTYSLFIGVRPASHGDAGDGD